ncbi:hypothetical protein [Streptomyces sp. NBC_00690]|uniref:hypothetical protein n=1 Tax=Streptomyces sp. NBC_00690 TaxID=2975808 RepID=UPI002E29A31C|nr:hypothetical protein [Streptomyces sp. NBC_00690]
MLRLRRLRLENIGHKDARFNGTLLDIAEPGGRASDAIVWLRNGGGKSSLLALFFSLLLPGKADFIGYAKKKGLIDYVLEGKPAHVIAEWEDDANPFGIPALITGAVYQWPDGHRPASDDDAWDKLQRAWYTLRPYGTTDLTTLPVHTVGGWRSKKGYLEALTQQMAANHHLDLHIVNDRSLTTWDRMLSNHGLDPQLLQVQRRMNLDEGAITELFQFDSAEGFLELLIDLVVDPAQPTTVRTNVKNQAERLAKRPARELELRFLTGAITRLRPLQQAIADTTSLHGQMATVHAAGELACTWISARRDTLTAQQAAADTSASQAQQKAEQARTRAEKRRRRADVLDLAAAVLTTRARQADQKEAEAAQENAEALQAAWQSVHLHLEREGMAREQAELNALLARRAHDAAPLKQAMERAGAMLHAKLTQVINEREHEAGQLTQNIKDTEREGKAADQAEKQHLVAAEQARSSIASLQRSLQKIDTLISQARHDNLLEQKESPEQGHERWSADTTRLETRLDHTQTRLKELTDQLTVLGDERDTADKHWREADNEYARIWDRWDRLRGQQQRLSRHPRLTELAHLDDELDTTGSGMNLDIAGHPLLQILQQEITRARDTLIAEQLAVAADRRALACLETEGFLPAPLETERALAALQAANSSVKAVSGLQFLRDSLPPGRHAAAIAKAPDVVGGIVVLGNISDQDLRRHIVATGVSTRSVLSVCDSATARARLTNTGPGDLHAVFPVQAAALQPQAADDEQIRLATRINESAERCRHITTGQEEDQALARELAEHLEAFGAAPHRRLKESLERTEARRDTWKNELDTQDDRHRRLQSERDRIERETAEATGRLRHLAAGTERARQVAEQALRTSDLQEQLDTARQHQTDQQEQARLATIGKMAARKTEQRHRRDETLCRQDLKRHRSALRKLTTLVTEYAEPDLDLRALDRASLDALQERFANARTAFESDTADTQLRTDLAVTTRRLQMADKALAALDDATRTLAAELATRPEATDPDRRDHSVERATHDAHDAAALTARCTVLAEQAEKTEAPAAQRIGDTSAAADALKEFSAPETAEAAAQATRHEADQAEREHTTCTEQRHALKEKANAAALTASSLHRAHDALRAGLNGLATHWTPSLEEPVPDAATWLTERCDVTAHGASAMTEEQAHQLQGLLTTAITDAQSTLAKATRRLATATRHVQQLATDRQYADAVDAQLVARLSEDPAQLHASLPTLIPDIELREKRTTTLLNQLTEDQLLLVQECAALTKTIVATLHQVARHSKLPTGLGAWSGKPFLTLKLADWGSEETLTHRISTSVDTLVANVAAKHSSSANVLPPALDLAKRLVLAALGGSGSITAKVLKPHPVPVMDPVDVTKIRKFSGGELLTVSVLLYCCLAQVRAANRNHGLTGGVGTLLLDNPMGKSNYVPFIDLQRAVAAAHGIQLIYTTGVEDLDAVGRFPLILRLRNNAHDARSGHRLVQLTERYGDTVSAGVTDARSDGIRAARLHRPPLTEPGTQQPDTSAEPDDRDGDDQA